MLKTLGTTVDWKNPDRALGMPLKIKMNFLIQGVYNIPLELRGKNKFNLPYKFSIKILGHEINGGIY